jgi:hypothetical protein
MKQHSEVLEENFSQKSNVVKKGHWSKENAVGLVCMTALAYAVENSRL